MILTHIEKFARGSISFICFVYPENLRNNLYLIFISNFRAMLFENDINEVNLCI